MELRHENRVGQAGEVTVVTVHGERLDLVTVNKFKKQWEPLIARCDRLVLDLAEVQMVDSSGFGAILGGLRQLSDRGGDIKLCNVQKRVRILLEMVRMHKIIGIHNNVEEAIAAFGA
ncbi:MAG: STAS domain-containing protein [Capsulimonadales bacterium]|nr:STAS domain-containing protein [Capsulimonadales bacterium]